MITATDKGTVIAMISGFFLLLAADDPEYKIRDELKESGPRLRPVPADID